MSPAKIVNQLIIATCCVAIFCAAINPLFLTFFRLNGPQYLLSLSFDGLGNYYIWQPFTYIFVLKSGAWGLSIDFIIELFIALYLLWVLGSSLVEKIGVTPFLRLYLLSAATAGVLAALAMALIGQYPVIAGPSSALLTLLALWSMFNPESELLFFGLFAIRAKWLLRAVLLFLLLIDISHFQYVLAVWHLSGAMLGYIYGAVVWQLSWPFFGNFYLLDHALSSLGVKIVRVAAMRRPPPVEKSHIKVYDIHSGKPLVSDERFMDEMLEKISDEGEHSLSWRERRRMKQISLKKSQRNRRH